MTESLIGTCLYCNEDGVFELSPNFNDLTPKIVTLTEIFHLNVQKNKSVFNIPYIS